MTQRTTSIPTRTQLRITQKCVVEVVMRLIKTEGLEAAREKFDMLSNMFCTEKGWAQTANKVYEIFIEEQQLRHQQQLSEEMALKKAGAPSYIILNQNEATAGHKVGQWNNMIESGANVTYTKGEYKE